MRLLLSIVILFGMATPGSAQREKRKQMSEEEFARAKPAVGQVIPDVTVHDSAGKGIKTSSLRGHYTVLTFGCLT